MFDLFHRLIYPGCMYLYNDTGYVLDIETLFDGMQDYLPFSAGPLASKPAVRPFPDCSHLPALSPLSLAGVRRGLISCLVCEYYLALLLASVIGSLLYKLLLYVLRGLYF